MPVADGRPISVDLPFGKKFVEIDGSKIAYVDEGQGQPVVFLHGNPTSSYLWRNIIPYVIDNYRAIAPDLIGMGDSDKPDIRYTLEDHIRYIDGFIDALGLEDIVFVIHDWGSVIGMRYARLNDDKVKAIAFMEAIVPPAMPAPSYEAMGPEAGEMFRNLRTPGTGEDMVLEGNFFVERILPEFGVMRDLMEAEMAAYRAPYPTPESRRPTLQWPREIPIGGEPAFSVAEVSKNGDWLTQSQMPKLFFYAEPGALLPSQVADFMAANVPNVEMRFVGAGFHFLQEDHPHIIGQGLRDWLRRLDATNRRPTDRSSTTTQSEVTMSTATIHNPAEVRHFMRIKAVPRRIRVLFDGEILAESTNALRLLEVAKDFYDPILYIPEADISAALRPIDRRTHCPLKGYASYFDLVDADGTVRHKDIAWSYADAFDFAAELKGHVAFRPDLVTIEDAPLQ